jgi:hypothetical protein
MAIGDEQWLIDYFDDVVLRAATARPLPFRHVKFIDGTDPIWNRCHENVSRWVDENAGHRPVRGWRTSAGDKSSLLLDKHSAVTDGISEFDITPSPYPCLFIRHAGPDVEFTIASAGRTQILWPPAPDAPSANAWQPARPFA